MSGRSITPGGALLRSSRVFSMPKPLPETAASLNDVRQRVNSPTATRHTPQYQAITSPLASRDKGDWGLKRPFPLKTTLATSTPSIRVKQLDTVESVTDFASAADHALSREKFQEMRIAMAVPGPPKKFGNTAFDAVPKSAFEEDFDVTDLSEGTPGHRWKFKGPWLASMTEGEFGDYLAKKVHPVRADFKNLLRAKFAEQLTAEQNRQAGEKGEAPPPAVTPDQVPDAEFSQRVRALRQDRASLYTLVCQFLDLPPVLKNVSPVSMFMAPKSAGGANSPWTKTGPPASHPSAGISYLRTTSYMENHAVYGPQKDRAPVLARINRPRALGAPAKLGVGGFIAMPPSGENEFNLRRPGAGKQSQDENPGMRALDLNTYGGGKGYVNAQSAVVSASGKIEITLNGASMENQLVAKEAKGKAKIYNRKGGPARLTGQQAQETERLGDVANTIMADLPGFTGRSDEKDIVGSSSSYGLKLD